MAGGGRSAERGYEPGDGAPRIELLPRLIKPLRGVRMAVATAGRGVEGFRRGHLDALATRRLPGRLRTGVGVVHADNMGLIALMTQHLEAVRQFITHTLGDLTTADKALRRRFASFQRNVAT